MADMEVVGALHISLLADNTPHTVALELVKLDQIDAKGAIGLFP